MPLAWDLTKEIQNWLTPAKLRSLNEGWKTQGEGFPEEVIADFERVLADPGTHYEAKLGYLQTQFSRQRELAKHYHGLYSWLVELVYRLLYHRHVQNDAYITRALRYFAGVAGLAEANRPLWVFSLNHDLMVECIGAQYGVPICSGLTERSSLPLRGRDLRSLGELQVETRSVADIEQHGLAFAAPGTKAINLLKIHGALDLFTTFDGDVLLKLLPSEHTAAGVTAALRHSEDHLFYTVNGVRVKALNEIAYADANGVMQFLRRSLLAGAYKFDQRMSQVLPRVMLNQFGSNLNYVHELVCIGYGFGDNHINDVIRRWLELTADRRLVVVSPGATPPACLAHLCGQVTCEGMRATAYLDRFAADPLTVTERAMRSLLWAASDHRRQRRGFA